MAMTEDERRRAVLFNDITHVPLTEDDDSLRFGVRRRLADWLWQQGWRRDVRPEDVNYPRPDQQTWARPVPVNAPGAGQPAVVLHLVYDDTGRALVHEAVLAQLLVDAGWERTR